MSSIFFDVLTCIRPHVTRSKTQDNTKIRKNLKITQNKLKKHKKYKKNINNITKLKITLKKHIFLCYFDFFYVIFRFFYVFLGFFKQFYFFLDFFMLS